MGFPRLPIRDVARAAGILGLISAVAGGFGEGYVPGTMMLGDAAATSERIRSAEHLFRWGFAAYMVEGLCDATLTVLFWRLLHPVNRDVAMLMLVLRVIATCGFAAAQVLYFSALPALRSGSAGEGTAFVLLAAAGVGRSLFTTFYGAGNLALGLLLFQAGFIPRPLGALMLVAGASFVLHGFLAVLAPRLASPLLLMTAALAFIPLITWLLVRGVNQDTWERARSSHRSRGSTERG